VPLPNGLERAPNVMISLVQCKLLSDTETSGIVVKMEEAPFNYYSADNKGCALGVTDIDYRQTGDAFFHYGLDHDLNPAYNIASNTRSITLFLESSNGDAFSFQNLSTYTFIFKLEYPVQPPAGIVNQFAAEIHRGI
tara:strand:+ start:734 stop:1144 length:411 start_codon:yes stop_codon:yes gene_type:complete